MPTEEEFSKLPAAIRTICLWNKEVLQQELSNLHWKVTDTSTDGEYELTGTTTSHSQGKGSLYVKVVHYIERGEFIYHYGFKHPYDVLEATSQSFKLRSSTPKGLADSIREKLLELQAVLITVLQ